MRLRRRYDLEGLTSFDSADMTELAQQIILVEKKKNRRVAGSHAKRGSGAARRRKKRDGAAASDGASMCSGTTYQSEYSDLDGLDALAVSLHEEGEDEAEDGELRALRGFLEGVEEESPSERAWDEEAQPEEPVAPPSGRPMDAASEPTSEAPRAQQLCGVMDAS